MDADKVMFIRPMVDKTRALQYYKNGKEVMAMPFDKNLVEQKWKFNGKGFIISQDNKKKGQNIQIDKAGKSETAVINRSGDGKEWYGTFHLEDGYIVN